jgi:hypothetical protein
MPTSDDSMIVSHETNNGESPSLDPECAYIGGECVDCTPSSVASTSQHLPASESSLASTSPELAPASPLIDMELHDDPLHFHRTACKLPYRENGTHESTLNSILSGRVLFGTNIDAVGWTSYMTALQSRIPPFLWCGSEVDVLRLMRQVVEGMSTPQVYMKTPGVWTGGHEENARL